MLTPLPIEVISVPPRVETRGAYPEDVSPLPMEGAVLWPEIAGLVVVGMASLTKVWSRVGAVTVPVLHSSAHRHNVPRHICLELDCQAH